MGHVDATIDPMSTKEPIQTAYTTERIDAHREPKPKPVLRGRVIRRLGPDILLVQVVGIVTTDKYFIKAPRSLAVEPGDLIEFDEDYKFVRVVPTDEVHPAAAQASDKDLVLCKPCPDCAHTSHPGEFVGLYSRGVCKACQGSAVV